MMKNKKRTLSLLLCLLAVALFLGSFLQVMRNFLPDAARGDLPAEAAAPQEDSLTAEDGPSPAASQAADLAPMLLVNSPDMGNNLAAGDENGYYLYDTDPGGYLLYYVDYATHQKLVLCADPACTHQSDSCPARFSRPFVPFVYDGQLYLLRESTFDPGVGTDEASQQLIRMEPDGGGRQVIARFGGEEMSDNLVAHGGFLYNVQYDFSRLAEGILTQRLVRVSLQTGALETIQQIDGTGFLLGEYGDHLLLHAMQDGQNADTAVEQQNVLTTLIPPTAAAPSCCTGNSGRGRSSRTPDSPTICTRCAPATAAARYKNATCARGNTCPGSRPYRPPSPSKPFLAGWAAAICR